MNTFQKIVKYVAIAFAIFLSVSILKFGLDIVYIVLNSTNLVKSEEKYSNVNFDKYSSYLDIDLGVSSLTIKKGDSFRFETNVSDIESYQDGSKLVIKDNKKNVFKTNNNYVILYVPEKMEFEKVVIDMGVGKLNVEDVNLNNVDLNLGIGKVYVKSTLTGKNRIECGIGEVDLNLNLEKELYTFKVSKGLGAISLNNESIDNDTTIGEGINKIDVDGGIGKIAIKTK